MEDGDQGFLLTALAEAVLFSFKQLLVDAMSQMWFDMGVEL